MTRKALPKVTVTLDKIVGGGQALATEDSGRKLFAWGGLPGETVEVQLTKKKSHMAEGIVTHVLQSSPNRVSPKDEVSYLSTSPWQIMNLETEQHYKAALIEEAFELHDIILPNPIEVYTDNNLYGYRNKIEFSWWWDKEKGRLELAFFKRGSHSKVPVEGTSLAQPVINIAAKTLRDILRQKIDLYTSNLKTLLVRCDRQGRVVMQLYVKEPDFAQLTESDFEHLKKQANVIGFELIFSEPKSPASVITKKLQSWGKTNLTDTALGIDFNYATEGFFQINLPVYEAVLKEIKKWIDPNTPVVDLYSGVGTIGLTATKSCLTMVEPNKQAVIEMKNNTVKLGREKSVKIISSTSEKSLDYINGKSIIIVDPPRIGLHENVIKKIMTEKPKKLIYLSCNPVTQARDLTKLLDSYKISFHEGYNFFPRTPHIEHLAILELIR